MTISINAHDITKTTVRNCADFVTVEFSNPYGEINLFFPDHAAVQAMIAELTMAGRWALEEWRAEVLEQTPD